MSAHQPGSRPAHNAGFVKLGSRNVCRMGFGTMRLTGAGIWGLPRDRAEAVRVLPTAVELGVQFLDTADSYRPNVAEELIAEALWPYAPGIVITTKGGYVRPGPDRWQARGRPRDLVEACEGSLKRLRMECHPLYQLHGVDPDVPLADSLGALVTLKEQGKIEHIGISNVSHAQLLEACSLTPIASVQNRYNVADRSSDAVLAECERRDILFVPYSPLQSGKGAATAAEGSAAGSHTPAQQALRWLLERSPVILPIPGTSSVSHLIENVESASDHGMGSRSGR